jgi:saccharopine dehydrogenase-like NADP-dependent oxidoreductase
MPPFPISRILVLGDKVYLLGAQQIRQTRDGDVARESVDPRVRL